MTLSSFSALLFKMANFEVWCLNYVSVPESNLLIAEHVVGKRSPKEKYHNKGNLSIIRKYTSNSDVI